MTPAHGSDGRPLVTTAMAAYSLGKTPGQFRAWASRHQLKPTDHQPNGRRGQPEALWDLALIAHHLRKQHAA